MISATTTLIDLGEGRWAHASGALWLPDCRTAIVADIHLGYGWALRRRGQLGPTGDAGLRGKLAAVVADLQPASLVLLGDLVHAPRPAIAERAFIVSVLQELAQSTRLTIVRGNHDRGLARDFPELIPDLVPDWRCPGILAVHGDRLPETADAHLVIGHLHPAFGIIDDAGATRRMPIFLSGTRLTVLPAFSTLAAGFDVRGRLPNEISRWFGEDEPCVVAASGKRAIKLGSLAKLRSKLL